MNESANGSSDMIKFGVSSPQSSAACEKMSETFLGFELLLFRRFQQQPSLWYEWRERFRKRADPGVAEDLEAACVDSSLQTLESLEELDVGDIHQDLWFLSVMVHRRPRHFLEFVREEIERERCKKFPKYGESLMMRYLNLHHFTVLSLDSMFKFGDDNHLPREIFRCPNVKYLSLKYNSLEYIPCDIGRMSSLEYLALTNNKLSVWSLPFSLTFLKKLHTLYLDGWKQAGSNVLQCAKLLPVMATLRSRRLQWLGRRRRMDNNCIPKQILCGELSDGKNNNLLDALPGFLLSLPGLETVHRHGNHNYFKSTFMWYHTDVNLRIIPVSGDAQAYWKHESLQFWAAKAIIGSKRDFFQDPNVVPVLKDYISDIYHLFNICHYCSTACLSNKLGFKVITFKNPYLGNTCVPFQHWACSLDCAKAVEIPARLEQISAARELDQQYENYIKECIRKFATCRSPRSMLSCAAAKSPDYWGVKWGDNSDSIGKIQEVDSGGSTFPRRRRNKKVDKQFPNNDSTKKKCGCVVS